MAEPRVALVTGGNRGIGFEVCRQLAKRGLRVVLTARTLPKAESAARTLQADGLAVVGARLDVADGTTVAALARNVAKQFRGIDVLVNNAAILLAENQDLLDTAIDDFRSTFETNVLGAIGVSQAFVPGMIAQRYGRVVNVSSRAGQLVTMSTYAPAYSILKTRASRECAELFSPLSSLRLCCQCCSFPIQGNRDKISMRKFDVGVFTQPRPISDVGHSRTPAPNCAI